MSAETGTSERVEGNQGRRSLLELERGFLTKLAVKAITASAALCALFAVFHLWIRPLFQQSKVWTGPVLVILLSILAYYIVAYDAKESRGPQAVRGKTKGAGADVPASRALPVSSLLERPMSLPLFVTVSAVAVIVGLLTADLVLAPYGVTYLNADAALVMLATVLIVPVVWAVISLFETGRPMSLPQIMILGLMTGTAIVSLGSVVLRPLGLGTARFLLLPESIVAMGALSVLSSRLGAGSVEGFGNRSLRVFLGANRKFLTSLALKAIGSGIAIYAALLAYHFWIAPLFQQPGDPTTHISALVLSMLAYCAIADTPKRTRLPRTALRETERARPDTFASASAASPAALSTQAARARLLRVVVFGVAIAMAMLLAAGLILQSYYGMAYLNFGVALVVPATILTALTVWAAMSFPRTGGPMDLLLVMILGLVAGVSLASGANAVLSAFGVWGAGHDISIPAAIVAMCVVLVLAGRVDAGRRCEVHHLAVGEARRTVHAPFALGDPLHLFSLPFSLLVELFLSRMQFHDRVPFLGSGYAPARARLSLCGSAPRLGRAPWRHRSEALAPEAARVKKAHRPRRSAL